MINGEVVTVFNRIPYIQAASPIIIGGVVQSVAALVQGQIQSNIVGQHIIDTGLYLNSWNHHMVGPTAAEVYSPVEYGLYHEVGTVHIPRRKHIAPAVERARPVFRRMIKEAVGR